ncbi:hypothetical protein QL285_054533 [Trifolium repens]|nr:hypothetical protein QL285_054533 [Trifolium repens]
MQTSLANDKGTTMRLVVAKTTPKKQNTTEDKTADADAEEVIPNTQRPANLNRFENLQQLKKSPANFNRFEKWPENLETKRTNHATSITTSSPPTTTTTTSPQHQQSSPNLDPEDAKYEHHHHHLNFSPPQKKSNQVITSLPYHCLT